MRRTSYKKHWKALIEEFGNKCVYCKQEVATCIDHILPYDWDGNNSIENLVPSCSLCNSIASDKVFESFEQKKQYILSRRKDAERAICIDCLLPYTYRLHSPSLFMCPECYDEEDGTNYSGSASWKKWLTLLSEADVYIDAHRTMKHKTEGYKRKFKLEVLLDEYIRKEAELEIQN